MSKGTQINATMVFFLNFNSFFFKYSPHIKLQIPIGMNSNITQEYRMMPKTLNISVSPKIALTEKETGNEISVHQNNIALAIFIFIKFTSFPTFFIILNYVLGTKLGASVEKFESS